MKVRLTPRDSEPEYRFVNKLEAKLENKGVKVTYPAFDKDSKGRRWFDEDYENEFISTTKAWTKTMNQQTIIVIKKLSSNA